MTSVDPHTIARLTGKPPQEIVERVKIKLIHFTELAMYLYDYPVALPHISYDLKGRTAGQAQVQKNHIKLNLELLLNPETQQEILNQTLPHEIAHLIHYQRFPDDREWHGRNWRAIMVDFGLSPDRCHTMPVKPARKTRKFEYNCSCGKIHQIGLNQHNKIQAGSTHYCRVSGERLRDMEWRERIM